MSFTEEEEEAAAKQSIKDVEAMIKDRNFENARARIEEAINMFPTYIENGQQMITVCEILHLCKTQTHKHFPKQSWPYTLMQIPNSSSPSEVLSRYGKLIGDLKTIKGTFSGTAAAMKEVDFAFSVYEDKKPKALTLILVGNDWKGNFAAMDAVKAIEDAKHLLTKEHFKSAKAKADHAIKLFPDIKFGQQMLNVCNIFYNYDKCKPSSEQIWPYVLQIPSSSTESEVEARYKQLMEDIKRLRRWPATIRFPGLSFAIEVLQQAMNSYRKCNPVPLDSDNSDGGDNSDDEDPFAQSPVFKKLRKEIFTTLPQNPDFSPLPKYCTSFNEVVKEGFEVIFVKLARKLQNLGDTLSHEDEDTIREELSNLEEMKYDVTKLRERFDIFVKLAKEDRDMEKELEAHISDEMVQLGVMQSRISELEKEMKSETLKSKVDKQGGLRSMLEEFKSIGMDIWK